MEHPLHGGVSFCEQSYLTKDKNTPKTRPTRTSLGSAARPEGRFPTSPPSRLPENPRPPLQSCWQRHRKPIWGAWGGGMIIARRSAGPPIPPRSLPLGAWRPPVQAPMQAGRIPPVVARGAADFKSAGRSGRRWAKPCRGLACPILSRMQIRRTGLSCAHAQLSSPGRLTPGVWCVGSGGAQESLAPVPATGV